MTIRLGIVGGTGDAFLVCGLLEAFRRVHGVSDVRLVMAQRLTAVARLYGVESLVEVNDELARRAEYDPVFQNSYPNDLKPGSVYFVHPSFVRTPVRIDQLTAKPEASQADMYRLLLGLPRDTPVARPPIRRDDVVNDREVVVIPTARSWPNSQPQFWNKLAARLIRDGWDLFMSGDRESLDELFERCRRAAWVIGPQCGVMAILCAAEFPCRKTLATPSMDGNRRPEYLAWETFPYGYVTKFTGLDYDVEEFKIEDDNHDGILDAILNGVNALRRPYRPEPVMTVMAPISPGDFLDRLAVLYVKMARFDPIKRAAIRREFDRFREIKRQMNLPPEALAIFHRMVALHAECYDLMARVVRDATTGQALGADDHALAIQANKKRVGLKQAVDGLLHAPYGEVKDYYEPHQP